MHRFREPVSGFTHLAGAILGLVGLLWLAVVTHDEPGKMTSMIIYGSSLVLLYSASAALHLVRGTKRTILWLNRLDHAAIYALIAGTYTPLCYNVLTGAWRWGMLSAIWSMAVAGMVFKLLFLKKSGHASTLFYVAMGWLAIIALPKFVQQLPPAALWLLAIGGLLYTLGSGVYAIRWPNFHPHFGFHEVWHLFVLGGSAFHFAAILIFVA